MFMNFNVIYMKNISQLIDEQVKSNPLVTEEEMAEIKTPLNESEICDWESLEEEVQIIDELAKKYALIESKAQFNQRVNNALAKRRKLNEQTRHNKNSC